MEENIPQYKCLSYFENGSIINCQCGKCASKEKELIEELKKLGWHYCYLSGHGDTEAISELINGESYIVGDIEKSNILVPPDCIWEKKVTQKEFYGY